MKLLRARNPLKYAPLSEIEGWLRHRGVAPPADVDGALDRLRAAEADWGRRLPGEEAPISPGSAHVALLPGKGRGPGLPPQEAGPRPSPGNAGAPTPPLDPSTSSTSPGNGQPEACADLSMSSTSTGNVQEEVPPCAEPPAPEDVPPIHYRPPPRPRIVQL
jgi:hypothetical protein